MKYNSRDSTLLNLKPAQIKQGIAVVISRQGQLDRYSLRLTTALLV